MTSYKSKIPLVKDGMHEYLMESLPRSLSNAIDCTELLLSDSLVDGFIVEGLLSFSCSNDHDTAAPLAVLVRFRGTTHI